MVDEGDELRQTIEAERESLAAEAARLEALPGAVRCFDRADRLSWFGPRSTARWPVAHRDVAGHAFGPVDGSP